MTRYFFDIHRPAGLTRDNIGSDCAGHQDIREVAMDVLPTIARGDIPKDSDRQAFSVLVRDENNVTVYTATMTFAGLWLGNTPIPKPEPEDRSPRPVRQE